MVEISFCRLTTDKVDDTVLKNRFIMESTGEYLAFINEDRITEATVKELFEKDDLYLCGQVFLFCAGRAEDTEVLPLKELLLCYSADVLGIVFNRTLLALVGKYNEKLGALTDYELACRMAECSGNCLLHFSNVDEIPLIISDEEVFAYAYLVKRYLPKIHAMGISEKLLTGMYSIAEQAGMMNVFQNTLQKMLSDNRTYETIAWNTAPYVVFRGDDTCYGVLRDFADSLSEGLRDIGETVMMLEPGKIDYDYLQQYICKGFIGFQSEAFKIGFFRNLSGAKIQFWLDNPIFYKSQFSTLPKDTYILCQDRNYAEYIKMYYGMKNAMHMPPGGHEQSWDEISQRPYDIVFIGSYIPERAEELVGINKDYFEYMISHPKQTFSQGLLEYLDRTGRGSDGIDISNMLTEMKQVCQQVINHFRKKVIDSVLQAGYELHVYGDSWNDYHSDWEDKLVRHSQVSVEESLNEWKKAKIGLNIMSWHKAGMTERVANIMLAGATCLSDETTYLSEHFSENNEIVLFSLEDLEELPQKIQGILVNDKWKEIARNGYHAALKEHTWKKRAMQLSEFVEGFYE